LKRAEVFYPKLLPSVEGRCRRGLKLFYNPPLELNVGGGGGIETDSEVGAGTGEETEVDVFGTGDDSEVDLGRWGQAGIGKGDLSPFGRQGAVAGEGI